ncbi:MAG: toxin-antitoxin system YwqK family antitoxin, partial [Owenweeksia sp.]
NRSSYINFANDERNGPFEAFFYDGTLSVKGNYLNGYYDGPYESYYPNGKLESKGVYKEGVQVGAWESYYYDGTLKSKASYDERGKQNGSQEKYDPNGKRELLYEYSKGEITAYTYFDKDGAILKKAERKKGKFWYEGYTLEGVKTIEGNYVGDHKDGHWKYYTTNGELDAEEDYNEEGQIIGEYKGYYPSGQLYQLRHFRKDTLHGYERMYHLNGNIKSEGNYVKGKAHGQWNHYFRDGALSYTNYYAAGKLNGPQYYYDPEGKLYMIKHFEMGSLASTASTNADSSVYKTVYSKGPEAMEAFYLPNGVAHSILPMVGGEYNGKALWKYGTGQLKCEGQYINDNRHGEWKWYHANGKPDQTGAYFTGTKIGQWNGFFTSGKPKYIAHYENGQMHGEYTRYYENGNLDYKVNYNQGEMDGKLGGGWRRGLTRRPRPGHSGR